MDNLKEQKAQNQQPVDAGELSEDALGQATGGTAIYPPRYGNELPTPTAPV